MDHRRIRSPLVINSFSTFSGNFQGQTKTSSLLFQSSTKLGMLCINLDIRFYEFSCHIFIQPLLFTIFKKLPQGKIAGKIKRFPEGLPVMAYNPNIYIHWTTEGLNLHLVPITLQHALELHSK